MRELRRRAGARRAAGALIAVVGLVAGPIIGLGATGVLGAPPAGAVANSSCAQFAVMPVDGGLYNVQTDEWNSSATQCVSTDGNADFDVTQFGHVARWNAAEQWIEMRLRSQRRQVVRVRDLDMEVTFQAGEDLLTEISAKFTPEGLEQELSRADFVVDAMWGADEGEYLLTLAHPYC